MNSSPTSDNRTLIELRPDAEQVNSSYFKWIKGILLLFLSPFIVALFFGLLSLVNLVLACLGIITQVIAEAQLFLFSAMATIVLYLGLWYFLTVVVKKYLSQVTYRIYDDCIEVETLFPFYKLSEISLTEIIEIQHFQTPKNKQSNKGTLFLNTGHSSSLLLVGIRNFNEIQVKLKDLIKQSKHY